MKPRAIRRLKMIAWLRDGGMCLDCGQRASETHEVVPRWYGERVWRIDNIISLCPWCHRLKHKGVGAHNRAARKRHLERLIELYSYDYGNEEPWAGILRG